ncbi:sigma factor binding protein 1, chloroplastic-like [Gastrolobium bilobum]|uniref:sigma factor binding protein 1, chloroplastic-like n=1 Tax=Gastrolobium bilobum TaxID=150636 RepID=UPI002AB042F4|nr:sigma factor binding protein 1, chloroplastic-like [Gastrolobium bilobum]
MDIITNSMSSVQQRTPTKRSKPKNNKNKNKPIKVVYISNPMKVKTSASEFRALVQKLTGRDAESPPDPSRYGGGNGGGDSGYMVDSDEGCVKKTVHGENDHTLVMPPQVEPSNVQGQKRNGVSTMENFEPFDDVFTAQMIENVSAFLPDSVFYECAQVDHQMLMQC